jgi:hypothetical protein
LLCGPDGDRLCTGKKKIPPVFTGGITMETPKTKPKLR